MTETTVELAEYVEAAAGFSWLESGSTECRRLHDLDDSASFAPGDRDRFDIEPAPARHS